MRSAGRLPNLVTATSLLLSLVGCVGGDVPHSASLDRFYAQRISWQGCGGYAKTAIDRALYSAASRAENAGAWKFP